MSRATELRARFLDLHVNPPPVPTPGILTMPNPWDIGSAKILESMGAAALATTSAGLAATLGRSDQEVGRDETVAHAAALSAAVDVPLNVDSEDCFADDLDGVAETARLLAATDSAGFSIEDFDPRADAIRPLSVAVERVQAAKEAGGDLVLTARAEALLYPEHAPDATVDDVIERLAAFRAAGADVVYAPGLAELADIERVVAAVGCPVNVLALPGAPSVPELASVGVSRVSVGSLFAWAAYGALVAAANEVFSTGTADYVAGAISSQARAAAFG